MSKSRPHFERFVASVTKRATHIQETGSIERVRQQLDSDLEKNEVDLYHLELHLSTFGTWAATLSMGNWLRKRTDDLSLLINGWRAIVLATKVREIDLYETAASSRTWSQFKGTSFFDHADYLERRWAVLGLYLFDVMESDEALADLLEVGEARGDVEDDWGSFPAYRFHTSIVRLVVGSVSIEDCTHIPGWPEPVVSFFRAWSSDGECAEALKRLATWHISQCQESLRSDWYNYYRDPYSVFPTWLLALVRHRHRTMGTTIAVDLPMIELGQELIKERRLFVAEPVIEAVEQLVASRLGSLPSALAGWWSDFRKS